MTSVTLEEAQAKLPEIVQQLQPGEEITITDHEQPFAHVKKAPRTSWPCKAGSAKDRILPMGRLMLAVKPLRKTARMADVSEHIPGMTAEEAYYWFSKVSDNRQGRRAQKALRMLAKE
jgi:antitoxin (DNA-binding transcriptional repressor) of toxin-antitoxin stability system